MTDVDTKKINKKDEKYDWKLDRYKYEKMI